MHAYHTIQRGTVLNHCKEWLSMHVLVDLEHLALEVLKYAGTSQA